MSNTSSLLQDIASPLAVLVAGLDPLDVPLPFAVDVWSAFGEIERLAAAGKVLMTARVEESRQWARDGATSAADWIALQSGTSVGRARAELGTSERLKELPLTADELRAGNLSAEQADVVADAAAVNPGAEADLIEKAKQETLKQLKDEAARRKAEADAADPEARQRRIHRQRKARYWVDREGGWNLSARGTGPDGAEIQHAIERLVNDRYRNPGDTPKAEREPREAYAFDALLALARDATSDAGDPIPNAAATRRTENLKRLMLIRVDLAALVRGAVGDGEVCEIDGIGPIPVAEARKLMGECILKAVITNGVAVANITSLTRGPNTAQKIAMMWSHPVCCVEGCNRTVNLEYDHRIEYAITKHTRLDEIDRPCGHHHGLHTHQGWAMVPGTGRRAMVPPGHPLHPKTLAAQGEQPPLFDTG